METIVEVVIATVIYLIALLFLAAIFGPMIWIAAREVVASRKAARYWREKWRDTITNEKQSQSLLRPTTLPDESAETLLRVTVEGEATTPDQLLRVAIGTKELQDR